MNKPSFKRMFYRYTLQDLPLYVAGIFNFYRYTLQDLPLYVAGFLRENSLGRVYEILMRIIRESHETLASPPPL